MASNILTKNSTFISGCFLSSLFFVSPLLAGEVLDVIGLDFGAVDFIPRSFEVVIDAKNGQVTPEARNAVVTGGRSGKITVRSDTDAQVLVEYPDSVRLRSSGESIVVSGVQAYSQFHSQFVELDANISQDIHVGGKLMLGGYEEEGTYSGILRVNLTFTVAD
jgi:hypothetical protein